MLEKSNGFMPLGHSYLWIPGLVWMHVIADLLTGLAYLGMALMLWLLVCRIRLPFSPVFVAFGLFIGLCGLTHFMEVWNVWVPSYWSAGVLKAATAASSVAAAIGLFQVGPRVERVVCTARLSEQRRLHLERSNAELAQLYAKLGELDGLQTRFFASMSHELRTPLALILGPAERMRNDSNLTLDQQRQLDSISRNGKLLLKQVDDLLDVARLDAGNMPVRYARLDLAAWFRRIGAQFEPGAEQRAIRYRITAPDTLLAEADPDLLERVLVKLLSNAFKFTPDGGQIDAELAAEWGAFRLRVADSGPGIRPDERSAIAERVRPAGAGAARASGGSGPGLAIVKSIVDLHHGRIEVAASPSGGSAFVVHLPRSAPSGLMTGTARRDQHAPEPQARAAFGGALHEWSGPSRADAACQPPLRARPGRPQVLVVDGDPDMRAFVAATLNMHFNVATAADGREGLARAHALQPDLIVTELTMPRASGEQLLAALRARPEFDGTPLLLLTAQADDVLRVTLLRNGAQDYLTKPFLPQELQVRAANLVAVKRAGDLLRRQLASMSLDLEGLATAAGTRQRQLQAAIDAAAVARQQAERASQIKSQFLAMVSHELRTPLAAIFLNLQLLMRRDLDAAADKREARQARLLKAAQQMNTLIEGLLEYARAESGRIEARRETVDLTALAGEVVDAHRDSVAPGVRLALTLPAQPPPPIASDARLLRVVLSNLVSNALKFTSQGTVTLRVGSQGDGHVVEVHDTGIGIPEADIPRIFLPFEQLEAVPRRSSPGVGLGLALAQRIVEALHGRLDVRSTLGAGSSFAVWLPGSPVHVAEARLEEHDGLS